MTADEPADPWAGVTAARLPAAGLAALAPVRARPGVTVHADGATAWVRWPAGAADVARCLFPVRGAEFFAERGGEWYRFGSRVPTAARPPAGPGRPVAEAVVPGRFAPTPPPARRPEPVRIGIVRGGAVRPTTAVRCRVADLLPWADVATTAELAGVRAARHGDTAILRGDTLPAVPGVRFWGATVLVPLGHRPDPDLPADVLRAAAGVAADELLVLAEDGLEAVPEAAFAPLTRAGVRLAGAPTP